MSRKAIRAALATAAVAVCLAAGAPSALATPGSGVTAKELGKVRVGDKDFVTREITIAPGGYTGWHHHLGDLYAVVTGGTLTHYDRDCRVDGVYPTGSPIFEPHGADKFHLGRNEGSAPVVLRVLYVLPADSPLAVDHAAPACAA